MEASFVSRARTAINSAAAKAEKVFTDIKKSDSITQRDLDKQSPSASTPESPEGADESKDYHEAKSKRVRPTPIKTKQDWHERFRNIRIGKRGPEDSRKPDNSTMAYAIFDDNLYLKGQEVSDNKDSEDQVIMESSKAVNTDIIPPSAIVKQLAVAIEAAVNYNSMKDLHVSSRGSSPIREKASLGISAMKSLVLREKEDKLAIEFGGDEKVLSVMNTLLNAEGHFQGRTLSGLEAQINATSLLKDIHGAPVESFVVRLSEAVGCLKTLRKMASFWSRVVAELRRLWCEGLYIPGIPPDDIPDLNSCLLYQQLQVINCCISRKRRNTAAIESLESIESVTFQASPNTEDCSASDGTLPEGRCFYAKTKSGEVVLRLGADRECENLTMLETGEPIYSPVLQEPPLLTEDLIKETEEFVLRTGSVGAGCSQLLSDMQAFKAANPGCILEDFVRWHSPPDWMENDTGSDLDNASDGGDVSIKGQLSTRMQKEGNLWRELWETSKPVPAVRQAPLYDEDLAVEGILDALEEISPPELFKQLFIVVLGSGLVIADATLATHSSFSSFFNECKKYIAVTCQGNIWVEKLDDICQVYETVETMLLNQDDALKITAQPEETAGGSDMKNRLKKLSLIFSGKNKSSSKAPSKDSNNEETPATKPFAIFSKKPPKAAAASPSDKPSGSVENDWTIV
ncbi:Rab3 GTPase-activating protein catalytic subunit [Sesamum alatum]|uniref:Rab3 GTPase-activating protein catalytic subunit n=1 Tax=Sesamum alatum TaxID=300844 RepID=A0AAE1Y025_9LAMI|nr:Rab3 GTPase-activating protein catalytic subunit [Sesamum alatum]